MRVAFSLLTLFPGRAGGSETYVRGVLKEFAQGDLRDQVTVLGNRNVMEAYAAAGLSLQHVPAYRPGASNITRFLAMNAGRLRPTLPAGQFDVVHYAVTVPIPRVRDTPAVVTLFDVLHHELPSTISVGERLVRRWAYDDAARRADAVVTISEHAKAGIVRHLGIAPERIFVSALGVDHAIFKPDGSAPVSLPERYLIYPANFWPHKNHARLLAALDLVGDDSLHLVLTGQTYGRESVVAGHDRVHVLGHIPVEQLAAIYRGALAMIYPSLFEGFGLPVLEAMACGTPVACSNRGAVADVAGAAALTFDPEDVAGIAGAVEQLTTDDAIRSRRRAAGLAHAAEFTWARCAATHVAAYRAATERLRCGAE